MDNPKPYMKVQSIQEPRIMELVQQTYEIENDYHIMAQVFSGEYLPTKDSSYAIHVK